jgi:hypothetical protein
MREAVDDHPGVLLSGRAHHIWPWARTEEILLHVKLIDKKLLAKLTTPC